MKRRRSVRSRSRGPRFDDGGAQECAPTSFYADRSSHLDRATNIAQSRRMPFHRTDEEQDWSPCLRVTQGFEGSCWAWSPLPELLRGLHQVSVHGRGL